MTKGRPATTGVDDAVIIAQKRGCVMRIVHGPESVCDLVIRTAAYVAFVKARRTDKITATIREIEHRYRDLIAELRLFPVSAEILRELWIYSKHGTYRFLQIRETGLVEVHHGMQAAEPESTFALQIMEAANVKKGEDLSGCLKGAGKKTSPGGASLSYQGQGIPHPSPSCKSSFSDGEFPGGKVMRP